MTDSSALDRLLGVSLLSAAGLVLELALTRLISVIYFPPYVFAVLALAVLGIGLGAALSIWFPALRQQQQLPRCAAGAALTTIALLLLLLLTPAPRQIVLVGVLLLLPYFFIGLALTTLFSTNAARSQTLYMADLIGAGLGVLLAIPLLNILAPINTILLAGVLFSLAAYFFHAGRVLALPLSVMILSLALLLTNIAYSWLRLDLASIDPQKPIAEALAQPGATILETRWDAFARTDLIQPADGELPRIYMDGAAGSVMPPIVDNTNTLINDIGFFPFATDQPRRVLVIGPGAGLDVWFGLRSNAREIVGVEVNPASVEIVRQYDRFNGGLYDQPQVTISIDDARSALERDRSQYDLIFLSQVVTFTAERTGFALTENTIYTVEAFAQYWSHLSDDGVLAIKLYDDITAERALATILTMLEQQGISNQMALQQIIALADPRHNPPIPLIMVQKKPYSEQDSLIYGRILRDLGFAPLFLPHLWIQPPLDAIWNGSQTFADVIAASSADLSPTTDDRPFFYQFERGIPANLQGLWVILALVITLTVIFVGFAHRKSAAGKLRYAPIYFGGLGIGFMLVEIAIIQQTRIFLGHPTLAVTAVLATFLIGGGLGSGLAGRWFARVPIHLILFALAGLLLLWMIAWAPLSARLLDASPAARMLLVTLCMLPFALLMGVPFSYGLRLVGAVDEKLVALAWVINGVMTVAGSALAVTVAILFGFSAVLLLGVLAYLVCAITAYVAPHP